MGKTENKYELLVNWLLKPFNHIQYVLYPSSLNLVLLLFFFISINSTSKAQEIDFTLKYNTTDNQYEVFGRANNSQPNFFVGGGSQLSSVVPATLDNTPLIINTVAGGLWTDNSQIFEPSATPLVDYH